MKKTIVVLASSLLCYSLGFAQNLVPNSSMETFTGCPSSPGQTSLATGWFNTLNSPDYLHTCGTATFGVPTNVFGTQTAFHGNAYFGLVTALLSPGFREHVGIMLSSPLVPGQTYRCRMLVSLADICSLGSNNIGFQFNTTNTSAVSNSAHVNSAAVITNKTGWSVVTGTFVAAAAYSYVFIGNFFNDASTTTGASGSGSAAWCYYYVDSVSVVPIAPLPIELASFSATCEKGNAKISWTTSSQINNAEFTIEKSIDGINYSEIGRIYGAGNSNELLNYSLIDNDLSSTFAYYRLKQTDYDGTSQYFDPAYLDCEHTNLAVIPNPNAGVFKVFGLKENSKVYITDLSGEVVFISDNGLPNNEIDISHLSQGIYYLISETDSEKQVEKVVIQ